MRAAARDGSSAASTGLAADVIVAGAGPGGLSAALALKAAQPGLKVKVLERAKQMRPSGGCIGTSNSIWKVLEAEGAEVLSAVKARCMTRERLRVSDHTGDVATPVKHAGAVIAWYDIQQALLSQLPEHAVMLDSAVTEVSEDAEGVLVKTVHGVQHRCKLLIGADGNRSATRAYVQPQSKLDYLGASVWRFFVTGDNPFVPPDEALVLSDGGKVLSVQRVTRNGEAMTFCTGISAFPEDRLAELNQTRYIQDASEDTQEFDDKLRRFRSCFSDFQPDLLDFVIANATKESVLEHPMYALDPRAAWTKGRVALLGDAAHTMPPYLAQGTPSALEDGAQLAASIAAHGLTAAALEEYERVRKARLQPIWDYSVQKTIAYYVHNDKAANPFHLDRPDYQDMVKYIIDWQPPRLCST